MAIWFFFIPDMAVFAGCLLVDTLQQERCLVVVEVVFASPCIRYMAFFALLLRIEYGGNFTCMYVFMTVNTMLTDISKMPLFFF